LQVKKENSPFYFLGPTMIELVSTYFHLQWKIKDHVIIKKTCLLG